MYKPCNKLQTIHYTAHHSQHKPWYAALVIRALPRYSSDASQQKASKSNKKQAIKTCQHSLRERESKGDDDEISTVYWEGRLYFGLHHPCHLINRHIKRRGWLAAGRLGFRMLVVARLCIVTLTTPGEKKLRSRIKVTRVFT
jgi:hypothetical protein